MPPGGRPPRGRPGRNNDRVWNYQQQRPWAYDTRVEELDTDDDNSPQGVGLEGYEQRRYHSDELRFTGIDLGRGMARRRRSGDYDEDFTPSEDEDDYEYDVQTGMIRRPEMQLALKEKEDVLLQRALERIARARALGKPNVKLSRAEIDALNRSERERNQPAPRPSAAPKAAPKSKKDLPLVKRKPVESRKTSNKALGRSASDSPTKGKTDGRGRGKSGTNPNSARESRDNSITDYDMALEYDHRAPYARDQRLQTARQAELSRRGSRSNSNQSLRQQQVAPYQQQHPFYTNRYSSNPDVQYGRPASNSSRTSRPDPSEMDWEPRARSTSSLVNVPLDQLPYQKGVGRAPRFDPQDPRFASPKRRVASGPPATPQPDAARYRRPQDELFLPEETPEVYDYLQPSEQEEEDEDEAEAETEDSDYDAGMEVVDVRERPGGNYAIQTRSAAAAASSSQQRARAGTTGRSSAAKSRKGR